ncbi:CaiB/BaiF CoA-transferase family protein [Aquibium sp. ELW1220]|uniref:CaiB/BaiF CoA transferase family protein n=1 Tax=Aquibium sp. ELW1220 TaxID=2976766 RepID=UPI0025AFDFD2|nr:CaiB/BaiF CoA-transferase family protein [Aquibium sp. ELW1220]MDN2580113.1 CoA transferase [Aquibium sp. ELW1220]
MGEEERKGPLAGLKVIEMAGLGPVPLAALILSEMGASVLRVDRLRAAPSFLNLPPELDLDRHGRETLRVDLKAPEGIALMHDLAAGADVLIEGFRPGVMERLSLGPDELLAANPGLVYGRMTGFGQEGPLAQRAGHDLTYLAMTGMLHAIGPSDGRPVPPLNLVADYGGGTMFLIAGVLAALFERSRSGRGQVIDAAMIDGASTLGNLPYALLAAGLWQDRRGSNLLDSGAPFYDTYETADAKHLAIACLEPQFFAEFAGLLPLEDRFVEAQYDPRLWPEMRAAIAARVATRTRDEWWSIFAETDACVAPVLSMAEAPEHPHNVARGTFRRDGRLVRAAPAPRFSRTPSSPASQPSQPSRAASLPPALEAFGISPARSEALARSGLIAG